MTGGEHWKNISIEPTNLLLFSRRISLSGKIHVDSRNADIIYSLGYVEDSKGVYKSIDGGSNWKLIFDATSLTNRLRLLMDPLNSDRLLLLNKNIKKSTVAFLIDNGGNSWRQLNFIPPYDNPGFYGLDQYSFNPKKPDGLFYWTKVSNGGYVTNVVYESTDLGFTWHFVSNKEIDHALKISSDIVYSRKSKLLSPEETTENVECLFTWAEQLYPTYFSPALAGTQNIKDYNYRYYNETNTYLGVFRGEKVHMLQADSTDNIVDVGFFDYFQRLAGC